MRYPTDAAARALGVLIVFTLFASDFWRNLIGWWGYLGLAAAITAATAVLMTRRGLWRRLDPRRLPRSFVLFLLLAVVSIAWSFYPGATALGILAQLATTLAALFLVTALSWPKLIAALGTALTWIVGLSLLFELIVAVFVRAPVLPFFTDYSGQKVPKAFYWSQAELLHGGPIQGIVGNRNLLAFVALLALIVVAVQLVQKLRRRGPAIAWIVVALATLALTRSATAIAAGIVVAVVLGALLLARRVGPGRRNLVAVGLGVVAAGAAVAVAALWPLLLTVAGKSDDLTGRVDIWSAVSALAAERPAFGWGWVSYWVPWVEPFEGLAVRNGVTYLQAHNAWLDVQLQLGIVGLVLFAALVLGTWHRAWWFAVDAPLDALGRPRPALAITFAPALLLTAQLAQSLAESRLLVEGGWLLFVVLAVKTKLDQSEVGLELDPADERAALAPAPRRAEPVR